MYKSIALFLCSSWYSKVYRAIHGCVILLAFEMKAKINTFVIPIIATTARNPHCVTWLDFYRLNIEQVVRIKVNYT